MPKRIVDGEGVWQSTRLTRVKPLWVRAEYANLIPLALVNGTFEANPDRIWSQVYSLNRPDITKAKVKKIISSLRRANLLYIWKNSDGKEWGYWVGIEKPGRLPPMSRRGAHERKGVVPPKEDFRKFLESIGYSHEAIGYAMESIGCLGFGFGIGSGFGFGSGTASEPKPLREEEEEMFNTLCKRYRSEIGADASKTKDNKQLFASLVVRYGEDEVLEKATEWIRINKAWIQGQKDGLREVLRSLSGERVFVPRPRRAENLQGYQEQSTEIDHSQMPKHADTIPPKHAPRRAKKQ